MIPYSRMVAFKLDLLSLLGGQCKHDSTCNFQVFTCLPIKHKSGISAPDSNVSIAQSVERRSHSKRERNPEVVSSSLTGDIFFFFLFFLISSRDFWSETPLSTQETTTHKPPDQSQWFSFALLLPLPSPSLSPLSPSPALSLLCKSNVNLKCQVWVRGCGGWISCC